jgi:enoyl-CoA hydratase/carnithine racemase
VTIDNPAKLNALDPGLLKALRVALKQIGADIDVDGRPRP